MTYDVVAVNISTSTVRVIGTNKSKENAEAIVSMAVMQRGVEEEFFAEVKTGAYKTCDAWKG